MKEGNEMKNILRVFEKILNTKAKQRKKTILCILTYFIYQAKKIKGLFFCNKNIYTCGVTCISPQLID